MIGNKKHSLSEILTNSPVLKGIVNKVEQLSKLNRLLQAQLDPELVKKCRIANLRDGILILTTASSTTGHLLQFAKAELLSNLRGEREWCHLKSIKIHVRPETAVSPPRMTKKAPIQPISSHNQAIIHSIAHSLTSSSLQKALLKLIQRKG